MQILRRESAPRYQRDGCESFLLTAESTAGAQRLTVTRVEIQPGGVQHDHAHDPEQSYLILEGEGRMRVGEETQMVHPGDCIFIPSGNKHGLVNTGAGMLIYLSAASPSFGAAECRTLWPLPSLTDSATRTLPAE
jgi:quercetin dioxygenase-like cupin family protein